MATSRVFIRGLPPSLSDNDFKKHFSSQGTVTDSRLFSDRRIGYIGYKTSEEAERAVKYFNRTFIKMSKIAVELAKSVEDAVPYRRQNFGRSDWQDNDSAQNTVQYLGKRKREIGGEKETDPKLKEYLEVMGPRSKAKRIGDLTTSGPQDTAMTNDPVEADADPSDDEYQTLAAKAKKARDQERNAKKTVPVPQDIQPPHGEVEVETTNPAKSHDDDEPQNDAPKTDADWLRSRTSRLLGLDAEEDDDGVPIQVHDEDEDDNTTARPVASAMTVDTYDDNKDQAKDQAREDTTNPELQVDIDDAESKIRSSSRLYLRNLSYDITEDDLRSTFAQFGNLEEVHVPMDPKIGKPKGFAYLLFENPDSAIDAWTQYDGRSFQGRLLHVLPAAAKRETVLDDFALSKLPLKTQQQIKRKRDASTTTFNWNSMYMNADAVMSSVADRLGVSKSELLDPTSSDAAIRQAHAETHVIQETKAYFKNHGVDLDAFKRKQRGDTAILVKNFPYDAKSSELKDLFEEHGKIKNFLMPPTGTIAIVEFEQAPQARAAFAALAYRKIKSSVLFLEKAPKDLIQAGHPGAAQSIIQTSDSTAKEAAPSAADLLQEDTSSNTAATSTLFVRNLNFTTTSDILTDTFKLIDGFISARVKTRTDSKKPGQVLSMGFGFVEFKSKAQAQVALSTLDGYSLEGHKLEVKASHKGADAAEERRQADKAKKLAGRSTKIIIKNLPFETSKKDVRALFGAYGQLRSIRVPKKFDKSARGFAFAEFTTPKEAESAMDALRDTHLLGRRLVLDFAEEDPEDAEAEIEKMQKKVGSQMNKVALQKLTGSGRKKFNVGDQDGDEA